MSIEQRKLISTHIEKTAGTSLRPLFESAVEREHIALYDAGTDKLRRGTELFQTNVSPVLDRLKLTLMNTPFYGPAKELAFLLDKMKRREGLATIPPDVLIIHGHFLADKYDYVVNNPLRSIVFRDPLDRMRSQYDHWSRNKGQAAWRVTVPYDPAISFEDYALSPELQNYQTQAVAGKPLTDFDVVGVTEDLDRFRDDLTRLFIEQGWCDESILRTDPVPRLNQTSERTKTDQSQLSPTFLGEFRRFHSDDYQLHDAATRLKKR